MSTYNNFGGGEGHSFTYDIPKLAFFGTKGGVGKTTIASKFADLVAQGEGKPNILMIDFDVDHRGLTVTRLSGLTGRCKTIHEYIATRSMELERAIDVTDIQLEGKSGRVFLIPAAGKEETHIFRTMANVNSDEMLEIIRSLIKSAINKYKISCVLIDCGPVVNPYTAAAAYISDMAFIIGQNEPITYDNYTHYAHRIREFYEDFQTTHVNLVLNKTRGKIPETISAFANIPFTMEVVDVTEGLDDIDEMRLTMFDNYIYDIVKKTFERNHPKFIPDPNIMLPKTWPKIPELVNSLSKSGELKISKALKNLLPTGIILIFISLILKFGFGGKGTSIKQISDSSGAIIEQVVKNTNVFDEIFPCSIVLSLVLAVAGFIFWRKYGELRKFLNMLSRANKEGLLHLFQNRSGRRMFEKVKKIAQKFSKK